MQAESVTRLNYVVIPDETAEVIYAAVRDGHDDVIKRLASEGFEPTSEIPGWQDGNGWSLFIKRLFTVEAE